VYRSGSFDVLFPTQEQVAVLSRAGDRLEQLGVVTAVPAFDALRRVQDKISARATLLEVGLPQPDATVVTDPSDLAKWTDLPVFVKTPIGAASTGVHLVKDRTEARAHAATLEAEAVFSEGPVLVQSLLDRGADPLLMNKSGSTPLHLAVQNTGKATLGRNRPRRNNTGSSCCC